MSHFFAHRFVAIPMEKTVIPMPTAEKPDYSSITRDNSVIGDQYVLATSLLWAALDIVCAFFPVCIMVAVFANPTATQLSSRAEVAALFFFGQLHLSGFEPISLVRVRRETGKK
jgi:hypothetical protein